MQSLQASVQDYSLSEPGSRRHGQKDKQIQGLFPKPEPLKPAQRLLKPLMGL
jgi:hypothetical protein